MFIKKYILLVAGFIGLQNIQAQTIDRNLKPAPGPAPVIRFKDPVIYKLNNGITLLVVEDHRLPKISASLQIDAGPIKEGDKAGVLNIMGGMLNEGTKTLNKAAFDEAVEKLGANVNLSSSGGSVSALTRYFPKAFELMGQGLLEPAFPQESFEKLKSQTITGLKVGEKNAAQISSRVTNALAYGKDHPEGEFETEASIQALSLKDVQAAYAQYITPSRSYLTIVGDIDPASAKTLTEKVLGSWKGNALVLPQLAAVPNPDKTEIDLIDLPSAVQSEIKLINLVDLKKNNPDYFPALLADYILGGGAQSHLFMNLREKHGFTYGAYSSLGSGRFQSTFEASASVRTAKTDSAVNEFIQEIKRIRTQKVTDEELSEAKALYNGSFALGLEDPSRTAGFASTILINDLPADFYKTYLQKINAVTPEDILRVAQKYIGDPTRIVIVGNSAQFMDGLKKLGYPIKMFDTQALPVNPDAKAAAIPSISGVEIIKQYIGAVGGATALKKILSFQSTMTMTMQGMNLNVVEKKLAPNKESMTISMGGNTVMKTSFDGTKGYQMQGPNKKDLTPEEVNQKKVFTSLTEQLDYLTNPAFKLVVKGIQKVDGADAYQLQVTDPSGKTSTEYYDLNTHYLVKNESSTLAGNNTVTNTVQFSDYRPVAGVKYPFKQNLTISAGGQEQNISMVVTDIQVNSNMVKPEDFN
jgi:predicted Zn-dependent peptidase